MEVPLLTPNKLSGIDELMNSPGANSEMKEATFEKKDKLSALSVEPTLIAVEMQAGEFMAATKELFPEATTLAIPTDRSWSIAGFLGSESQ